MNTDIFLYQQYAGDDYAAQEQRGGGDKQLAESVFHGDADERQMKTAANGISEWWKRT